MAIEWVSSKPAKLQGKRQAGVCWLEHFCMYQKAMQRLYWTEGVGQPLVQRQRGTSGLTLAAAELPSPETSGV